MIDRIEDKFWQILKSKSVRAHDFLFEKRKPLKYIIAGGTAASVDIGTLYILKSVLGLSLRPAVALSFLFGFAVSFTLQKFWAFEENTTTKVHKQAVSYFVVSIINFLLNLELMTLLVVDLHVWYILAKILVSGGIAFSSFFVYRNLIFKNK